MMPPLTMLPLILPMSMPMTWPNYADQPVPPIYESGSDVLGPITAAGDVPIDYGIAAPDGSLGSVLQPSDLARVEGRLIAYADLPANWDGEDSAAPSLHAIWAALRMLDALPTGLDAPSVMALASGDVALYWDYGSTYAEIGFDSSGKYYAYASGPEIEPVYIDDADVENESCGISLPVSVLNIVADCSTSQNA